MNALGNAYLALCGFAFVLALVHIAQSVVIRSDRTEVLLAALCLGFGALDLGITFSSEHTGAPQPSWAGWHLLAALSASSLAVIVPWVVWMVLEVKLTAARRVVLFTAIVVGVLRVSAVALLVFEHDTLSWEHLHSLDHPVVAIASVLCALMGSVTWAVEGVVGARRGRRYAPMMAIFGVVASLAMLHGIGVTFGVFPPPDGFGLITLPSLTFVQLLSSVRFVQAIQTANQPAGDMARYEVLAKLGAGGMGEI